MTSSFRGSSSLVLSVTDILINPASLFDLGSLFLEPTLALCLLNFNMNDLMWTNREIVLTAYHLPINMNDT